MIKLIFLDRPEGFKPVFDAVGCFILNQGEILLLLRADHTPFGNTWGLPSGKVEKTDKCIYLAMKREIFEETGLEIPVAELEYSRTIFVRNSQIEFVYHIYICNLATRPQVTLSHEHNDSLWIDPLVAKRRLLLFPDSIGCIDLVFPQTKNSAS